MPFWPPLFHSKALNGGGGGNNKTAMAMPYSMAAIGKGGNGSQFPANNEIE